MQIYRSQHTCRAPGCLRFNRGGSPLATSHQCPCLLPIACFCSELGFDSVPRQVLLQVAL